MPNNPHQPKQPHPRARRRLTADHPCQHPDPIPLTPTWAGKHLCNTCGAVTPPAEDPALHTRRQHRFRWAAAFLTTIPVAAAVHYLAPDYLVVALALEWVCGATTIGHHTWITGYLYRDQQKQPTTKINLTKNTGKHPTP